MIEPKEQPRVENLNTDKTHPTAETFKHIRHQINERIPQVKDEIFDKSGIENPTRRALINAAGARLRQEKESDYDVDTGLLNKLGYKRQKDLIKKRASVSGMSLAAAVIDLDDLKKTNDTMGHNAGDELIKKMANILKLTSRIEDILARVGGDEFKVILVNSTPEQAIAWKNRLIENMNKQNINASIGISSVNGYDIEDSMEKADKLMYEEKRAHKEKTKIGVRFSNFIRRVFNK